MIIYSLFEYLRTHNTSIAGKLILAQAEQIRRITAEEYIKGKCIKNVRWQQALKGERIWRRGN